jgi:hypothetical protein
MKKQAKDPVREDRIHNEAIADTNGPEEQVMGWHCYLDDKIRFLFRQGASLAGLSHPSGKGKPSKSIAWPPKMPARLKCSC